MNNADNNFILQIHLLLEDREKEFSKSKKLQLIFSVLGASLIIIPFFLASIDRMEGQLGVLLAAVGGFLIAVGGYFKVFRSVWIRLEPYVSRESIIGKVTDK